MWKKIILIVFLITCLSSEITAKKQNLGLPLYAATSFDYNYGIEPRRKATTTERPIVRYWNNFVRNLPIPAIPWNMTNTLANIFNAGASNVIETPVGNYHESSSGGSKRKQKTSKKSRNKNRRRPQDNYDPEYAEQDVETDSVAVKQQPPNVLLGSLPADLAVERPMYFYDPTSHQYFEIKRLRSVGQYVHDNYYNDVGNVEDHYDEAENVEEMLPQTQIVDNTNLNESNEEANDVENLDEATANVDELDELEDMEDDEDVRKVLATDLVESKPKKNEEMLRNMIGSFMQDDRFSRKRQRANTKRRASSRHKGKLSPRDNYRYYYMQG